LKRRIEGKAAFSPSFDAAVKYFRDVSHFAESLDSKTVEEREMALYLIKSEREHIGMSISYYLENDNSEQILRKNCLFVGRTEYFESDWKKLLVILGLSSDLEIFKMRKNRTTLPNKISQKGMDNLKNYLDKEYLSLEMLKRLGFLNPQTMREYRNNEKFIKPYENRTRKKLVDI